MAAIKRVILPSVPVMLAEGTEVFVEDGSDGLDLYIGNSSNTPVLVSGNQFAHQGSVVDVSDIVDNLTSTDADKPLSANQGKVLNESRKLVDVSSEPLDEPVLIREVKMGGAKRALREYVVQDIDIAPNTTTTIELPLGILRGTYHATGNIVGGVGGTPTPRVIGADFSLNAYATEANSNLFTGGEAFNGFTNQEGNPTYGNILDSIEFVNQNNNVSIQITNANATLSTHDTTVFIRLITGEGP